MEVRAAGGVASDSNSFPEQPNARHLFATCSAAFGSDVYMPTSGIPPQPQDLRIIFPELCVGDFVQEGVHGGSRPLSPSSPSN